jgi:hypothetical protein
MTLATTYDAFRAQWLDDVQRGNPSTVELGRRFAVKLVSQWLDVPPDHDDFVHCDGSGDGGVDVAFLRRAEDVAEESDNREGDSWYLVQSKYGSAFAGVGTLLREGQKIVDTLDGRNGRLSSLAAGLADRLANFRARASEYDRIVLVYGTSDALNGDERRAMQDVQAMGRARLGPIFDVEAASIHSIYEHSETETPRIQAQLRAHLVESGDGLHIGSAGLVDLYAFLKEYRSETDDLDKLYEKNVRRFLGAGKKINKRMKQTLDETPELFGLYNNGITLVASAVEKRADALMLTEPYIVNGCQTTRTIWEVCHQKLDSGGTGKSINLEDWKKRAQKGVVVIKVVTVASGREKLLEDITRFTNSQNAVREKDFLALHSDMQTWARAFERERSVYLEIQRGGWDSRRAWQKQHPTQMQFGRWANAFDLLKVYGAGWLQEAGTAFGKNGPFLPNGAIFKRITEPQEGSFGSADLYAAYRLQESANEFKFGRGADHPSRRQSRFLFYLVVVDLLRDVLSRNSLNHTNSGVTGALNALFDAGGDSVRSLLETAIEVIDEYFNEPSEDCVLKEPSYRTQFASDLNAFLKHEGLGKSEAATPRLRSLLGQHKRTMGRAGKNQPSPRDVITNAVRNSLRPEPS